MFRYSILEGDRSIAVDGLDKAVKLLKALAEANDNHQFLLQYDDCGIWVVSWVERGQDWGDAYIAVPEDLVEEVEHLIDDKRYKACKAAVEYAQKTYGYDDEESSN